MDFEFEPSVWEIPGTLETLHKMWVEGFSGSQIAAAIGHGVSRSSVIGKVHRLKLAGRPKVAQPRPRPQFKPMEVTPRRNNGGGVAFAIAKARKAGVEGSALDAVFGQKVDAEPIKTIVDDGPVISLLELNEHTCKWPIGDPLKEGFGFCGQPPVENKPYCAKHHARSIQRVSGA